MLDGREFEILNWEQEIIRAEKTIKAVCEAYAGRPDERNQTHINWDDIKHKILLEAVTIRRTHQEEGIKGH